MERNITFSPATVLYSTELRVATIRNTIKLTTKAGPIPQHKVTIHFGSYKAAFSVSMQIMDKRCS